ncbi:hypothetical protein SAMN04488004_12421 [Loktanella salsilacus]|uniref:Uncharacterized protein n=1 Tax=Loktanella salsilacus TaxID=195913 RepID=A0A1I4I9N4_9RHOB|nr:hypothetical protein SAMN04488004_12421 [Loktanella salsilacus]
MGLFSSCKHEWSGSSRIAGLSGLSQVYEHTCTKCGKKGLCSPVVVDSGVDSYQQCSVCKQVTA